MSAHRGFTLLEVLVTLAIITIVTFLAATAFSIIREREALIHARQQISSIVRAAQTQALNEQRHPACLAEVEDSPLAAKQCSDIGVFLQGEKVIVFADTNDNNQYDDQDFRESESSLPRPVTVLGTISIVIEATPPNVVLWHNGRVVPAGNQISLTLRAGRRTVPLSISSYGILENE